MNYICKIGSNKQNDLVISDRTVSDFHAQLVMGPDNQIMVKDLDSHYGTRINGVKVKREYLKENDDLRIGFTSIDWVSIRNEWMISEENDFSEEFDEKKKEIHPLEEAHSQQGQTQNLQKELAQSAGRIQHEYLPQEIGIRFQEVDLEEESEAPLPETLVPAASPADELNKAAEENFEESQEEPELHDQLAHDESASLIIEVKIVDQDLSNELAGEEEVQLPFHEPEWIPHAENATEAQEENNIHPFAKQQAENVFQPQVRTVQWEKPTKHQPRKSEMSLVWIALGIVILALGLGYLIASITG